MAKDALVRVDGIERVVEGSLATLEHLRSEHIAAHHISIYGGVLETPRGNYRAQYHFDYQAGEQVLSVTPFIATMRWPTQHFSVQLTEDLEDSFIELTYDQKTFEMQQVAALNKKFTLVPEPEAPVEIPQPRTRIPERKRQRAPINVDDYLKDETIPEVPDPELEEYERPIVEKKPPEIISFYGGKRKKEAVRRTPSQPIKEGNHWKIVRQLPYTIETLSNVLDKITQDPACSKDFQERIYKEFDGVMSTTPLDGRLFFPALRAALPPEQKERIILVTSAEKYLSIDDALRTAKQSDRSESSFNIWLRGQREKGLVRDAEGTKYVLTTEFDKYNK